MQLGEWQTINAQVRYPFAELSTEAANQTNQVPNDFFRGLSLVLAPIQAEFVYLSRVLYSSSTDSIALTFRTESGLAVFSGVFSRRLAGSSDVGRRRSSLDAPRSLIWVPGKDWDDPEAAGFVSGVQKIFEPQVGRLEASTVHFGIRSVTEVLLDAPFYQSGQKILVREPRTDPIELTPNREVSIVAGYNIDLKKSTSEVIALDVVPGAGAGYPPCPEADCRPIVRMIEGVKPDANGNLNLETYDCLRNGPLDLPDSNGFRVFSDCLPCCTCRDYNAVSRAISRQSAKLRDANDQLNLGVICIQQTYDDAADKLNDNLSGLIEVSDVQVYPSRLYFTVKNITSVPVYAVIAIDIPQGSDIVVLPGQGYVRTGIQTTSPPLTGLSGGPDTGYNDPTDTEGWRSLGYYLTIGGDANFGPLLGGRGVRVCLWSPSAETKLGDLETACDSLSAYYSTGSAVLENDSEYQGYATALANLALQDEDCFSASNLTGNDLIHHEYKCSVQEQAASLRKQELSDQLYARRLEIAFGVDICETAVGNQALLAVLTSLKNIDDLLATNCKNGSYTCTNGNCTSDIFDNSGCTAAIRHQTAHRDQYYTQIDSLLNDQEADLDSALRDCLGQGMFVDSMPVFDISVSAIYGDLNFGCKAFNGQFTIERSNPEGDTGYDCLEDVVAVQTLGTQL